MASGFFLLLDDIATILDDVALMSKVAAKKSAGILGDDLALNAEQVTGVAADRELPVVWAVAKGSFINKLILIPVALAISFLANWAIIPLLLIGGAYLCFEGFEKVAHSILSSHQELKKEKEEHIKLLLNSKKDLVETEKEKIKSAIRTDFILSAEIVVLTLGLVAEMKLISQLGVLFLIGILLTVGVYGLVAAMVKIDDLGLFLLRRTSKFAKGVGRFLLIMAPLMMKFLSFAGTAAMFMVGGGIFNHGVPILHHLSEEFVVSRGSLAINLFNAFVGILIGLVAFGIYKIGNHINKSLRRPILDSAEKAPNSRR